MGMLDALRSFIVQDVGIDLGTANTVVFVEGKGIVIQEPSYVAKHTVTGDVIAIGGEAKKMQGKAPKNISVIRPLRDGVIADFDAAEAMLQYYIQQVSSKHPLSFLSKPRVIIGIPSGVTDVERRAVQSAAISAGAGKAYLIEEPMAAAIGAGLKVDEPEGRMVVDIGGGTTEIAVISLGGIVLNRSLRIAGDELDEAVIMHVRTKHNVLIGEATAEQTKIAIGSAYPFENKKQVQHVVRGRDIGTGLPKSIKVSSEQLREALTPIVQHIITAIMETIEETPPELVADIVKHGLVLAGGTSQLRGLEQRISEEVKIPVWTTKEPHLAVVRGCGAVLASESLMKKVKIAGGYR